MEKAPLVSLAQKAVETFIKEKEIISAPPNFPKEFLERKSGVFVSIHNKKENCLRGCIGTFLPSQENIATEVIKNAISAATQDSRFLPIKKEELPFLSYTVYILNHPQLIKDLSELNPKKYGIIVKTVTAATPKTGLLLPDLEGIETVEKQIFIACQKAGIDLEKEKILVYKFSVEKYEENGQKEKKEKT